MVINFIVIKSWLTGGTRAIMELINALADRGHEVNLVSLGYEKELDWIELKGKKYFTQRTFIQKVFGFLYRVAFGFQPFPEEQTRFLMKAMPEADINIATMSYSAYAVHRSAHGVPFQYFMHYEPLVREEGYLKKIIEESYWLPTKKIVNSTWLANQIKERNGEEPVGLVFPAIDHKIFYMRNKKIPKDKNQKIKIISLAKYKWWKGTPDALKAVQIVRDAGYNVEFDKGFLYKLFLSNNNSFFHSYFHSAKLEVMSHFIYLYYDSNDNLNDIENFKLETLCNQFRIKFNSHNAMADIQATRELFLSITDALYNN